MTKLESLKVSLSDFSKTTTDISRFLETRFADLLFFPSILSADVDYKGYCLQLHSLKEYTSDLTLDEDTKIVKEKLSEMPDVSSSDFEYYKFGLSTYWLFLLFPIGLVVWVNTYFKLSTLQNKLRGAERTSGALIFMLRAMTSK